MGDAYRNDLEAALTEVARLRNENAELHAKLRAIAGARPAPRVTSFVLPFLVALLTFGGVAAVWAYNRHLDEQAAAQRAAAYRDMGSRIDQSSEKTVGSF